MSVIPVPTLSTFGWVSTPAEKIDFLLAHYVNSEKTQTALFGQNVANLQWVIYNNADDIPGTCRELESSLGTYLRRYYPENVVVETTYDLENEQVSASRVKITMSVHFRENGIDYSATGLIRMIDSKFENFTRTNNG